MPKQFKNLVEMQQVSCKKWGDRPMFGTKIQDDWHWFSFQQFAESVANLRGGLANLGLGPGDTVAIISRNSIEWAVCAYATYSLGGRFVPMYESQSSTDWEYIIKDSDSKLVFAHNSVISDVVEKILPQTEKLEHVINLHGPASNLHSYEGLIATGKDRPAPASEPKLDDDMGLIYTSGTTGKPKGVVLTHRNILSQIDSIQQDYTFTPEDRTLSFLPWAHIFGQTGELHVLLCLGFSAAFAESTEKISDNLSEIKPTMLMSVPRIFNRIHDAVNTKIAHSNAMNRFIYHRGMQIAEQLKLGKSVSRFDQLVYRVADRLVFGKVRGRFGGRLRYAISGGAALDPTVGRFLDNLGILVYEGYGLTETSPLVASNRSDCCRIGTVGKPVSGVRVVIDKEAVADKGCVDDGEIIVYGENVMKGYHKLPEETAEVLTSDGGFRTGDVGHFDEDGFLKITGRIKERYKLENGKWVVPAPIEDRITLSRFVAACMLYGENRPYNICIISVNIDEVVNHAERNGYHLKHHEILHDEELREILRQQSVQKLFAAEIDHLTKDVKHYEIPQKFILTADEWNPDTGMTTQTFKLRRMQISGRYADEIDSLFTAASPAAGSKTDDSASAPPKIVHSA
ncbi:MAG: AMP-dependent synthetase/ligase [Oligoflexus sp.]